MKHQHRWWFLKNRGLGDEILGIDIDGYLPAPPIDERLLKSVDEPIGFAFPRNSSYDEFH
jgi:hypothetical protein